MLEKDGGKTTERACPNKVRRGGSRRICSEFEKGGVLAPFSFFWELQLVSSHPPPPPPPPTGREAANLDSGHDRAVFPFSEFPWEVGDLPSALRAAFA